MMSKASFVTCPSAFDHSVSSYTASRDSTERKLAIDEVQGRAEGCGAAGREWSLTNVCIHSLAI